MTGLELQRNVNLVKMMKRYRAKGFDMSGRGVCAGVRCDECPLLASLGHCPLLSEEGFGEALARLYNAQAERVRLQLAGISPWWVSRETSEEGRV